jgi:hypothetical protein
LPGPGWVRNLWALNPLRGVRAIFNLHKRGSVESWDRILSPVIFDRLVQEKGRDTAFSRFKRFFD